MLRLALPATLCLTLAACGTQPPPDPDSLAVRYYKGQKIFSGWGGANFTDDKIRAHLRDYYCKGMEPSRLTVDWSDGHPEFKGACPMVIAGPASYYSVNGTLPPSITGVMPAPSATTPPATTQPTTTPTGQPRVIY